MAKTAKLVLASVMTRVIVEEGSTDEQIFVAAKAQLVSNLDQNGMDSLESIIDDDECPYGTFKEDSNGVQTI